MVVWFRGEERIIGCCEWIWVSCWCCVLLVLEWGVKIIALFYLWKVYWELVSVLDSDNERIELDGLYIIFEDAPSGASSKNQCESETMYTETRTKNYKTKARVSLAPIGEESADGW